MKIIYKYNNQYFKQLLLFYNLTLIKFLLSGID